MGDFIPTQVGNLTPLLASTRDDSPARQVPGGPGLKKCPLGAHVVEETVVTVPEHSFVLFRRGEEAPDLRILAGDFVHQHRLPVGIVGDGSSRSCLFSPPGVVPG